MSKDLNTSSPSQPYFEFDTYSYNSYLSIAPLSTFLYVRRQPYLPASTTPVPPTMSRRPNPAADRAEQNRATLKNLVKLEGNKTCADCKRNKRRQL